MSNSGGVRNDVPPRRTVERGVRTKPNQPAPAPNLVVTHLAVHANRSGPGPVVIRAGPERTHESCLRHAMDPIEPMYP